ncbi:ABC transporter permease [Marinoscillum pacificum]|uniref:ABC transporter permease n=1 Tax=Marinoscillum pacificum TaxID=392723 RepID=UPI002157F485|nr:FtsX-like permease family protein [Marinoscillum pacificum]
MNLPYFISKRITKNDTGSFSTVINRIGVVSVAVALAALIGSFMILKGFENTIKQKIYSFSGHLVVSKYTLSTSYEQSSIIASDFLMESLLSLPGVDYAQTYAFKAGLLKTEEEVQGVILKGLDQNFDTTSFDKHMIAGSFPQFPKEGYGTEVAVSARIANYLQLGVGDDVLVLFYQTPPRFRKLTITGIYETGLEDFDNKVILGDINLVRRLNDWGDHTVGGIEVFLDDPDKMDEAETVVFENTDTDLYVDKVSDKYMQIFDWLRLLDRNVIIFFSLILGVASFNMVSILLILIMERTQMVGVLKSLGASNGLIRRIFFFNGFHLILRGLFWGNLISLGFCWVQMQFELIPLDPENYYMNHVPILFDFGAVLWINAFVILITAVTLFIPLGVISRIKPIKAIRFD